MKKVNFIAVLLFMTASRIWAQNNTSASIPLIGASAPSFTAESTTGTIHFPGDYSNKWKILFSHPADFTPVCTSELLDLAAMQDDFNNLGTQIIVISANDVDSHTQWEKSMESINYKNRQASKINFPLVGDKNLEISRKYGMLQPSSNSTKDVRGVFIIDPKNTIRAIFFYPMNIGRNMDEIKRTVLALQTADNKSVLMPSGWQPGGDVLLPYIKYTSDQEALARQNDPDLYKVTWYMWGTKLK
jgi:peroxiredoxin (alkyl hydroperoxide reductase subunit C)